MFVGVSEVANIREKIGNCLGSRGQSMVEYAFILAFVVGVAVYFFNGTGPLGKSVNDSMDGAGNQLSASRQSDE